MEKKYLIDELAKLTLQEKSLLRGLDTSYYDRERRNAIFNKIKLVKKDISQIKFKLRLEREKENVKNNNTDSTKN